MCISETVSSKLFKICYHVSRPHGLDTGMLYIHYSFMDILSVKFSIKPRKPEYQFWSSPLLTASSVAFVTAITLFWSPKMNSSTRDEAVRLPRKLDTASNPKQPLNSSRAFLSRPIPNLLQESLHVHFLALHFHNPWMFQHSPRRSSSSWSLF